VPSGVVLLFVASTAISQHIDSAIAGRTDLLVSNAMPSIQMLSAARGQLRVLENQVEHAEQTTSAAERAALGRRITALAADIAATVSTYMSLPFFPAERPIADRAGSDLNELDSALVAFSRSPDDVHLTAVHQQIDQVDDAIDRIITFDAVQGQRLGLAIERTRGETRAAALLLDTATVALARLGVYLALRQLRRAARANEAERVARELREAELARQNEALGQFAGRVAHDILSPLAATSLSLELARYACADDTTAKHSLERGTSALKRVQYLVDGLLAFSRAGGRPVPGASCSLRAVLPELLAELRAEAAAKDIALELEPVPGASVGCSPAVLTSLVSNLVRNAIKYMGHSHERRVEVHVRELEHAWRFEVIDTGPGIPADQQARIFDPYVQLDGRAGGIGLGLATVDRLVRSHGGTVGVVSPVPGASTGTLFWFELPRTPAETVAAAPASAVPASS
jgi:signal transduction histidine kinase